MIAAIIFWTFAVISLLAEISDYLYGSIDATFNPILAILFTVLGFLCFRRHKMLQQAEEAEQLKQAEAEAARKAEMEKFEERRRQEKIEFERKLEEAHVKYEAAKIARQQYLDTHNLYETKVAGVTFDNPDRSSRQKILKALSEDPDVNDYEITLHPFSFQGKDAFYVYVEDHCIGTIPAMCVKKIKEIYPKTDNIELTISDFENEDEKTIYAARLTFGYPKESEEE